MLNTYDVIVVGGGHAGCEAAAISAKMGAKTLLITINFKKVGNMPCNPSIGGSAKGIIVREIDALGGMMGKVADQNYLQMKMLNTGKGPGVQCLRCQQDKIEYPKMVLKYLQNTDNLTLLEGIVTEIVHDGNIIKGVKLEDGTIYNSKAVILTTGTYMESNILVGHEKIIAGPDGEKPSLGLSPYLKNQMGLDLIRLKTGTPQRILKSSIDFSKAQIEPGTARKLAFSYETKEYVPFEEQIPCYLIYTTQKTKDIINEHLKDSAMYSGLVEGVGPRYCPSIEDKIVRFADKPRHQLFLEPESRESESIYLQGFSTSMPREVQIEMVHSLPGLENAVILKYAYAIEYDALDPLQFDPSLMVKKYPGLFIGGQICGTSGYEEAAGLGLMCGINAVRFIRGQDKFILGRDESYIGVMIDDLVNKGTKEPYRMLSSRAEFRLLLRHDNADVRLRKYAHENGTISEKVWNDFLEKEQKVCRIKEFLRNYHVGENEKLEKYLLEVTGTSYRRGLSLDEIIKRPEVSFEKIIECFEELQDFNMSDLEVEQIEVSVKYEGYIKKQIQEAEKLKKLDSIVIPEDVNYMNMDGLAMEARQKLDKVRPLTIGQASRISGVNPSDISILNMYLSKRKVENNGQN